MSISCAVLMCHAPIVIPAIAAHDAALCGETTEAMRKSARALVAHEPSLIVLISPHAPRRAKSIGLTFEDALHGDFSRFGHAELALRFPGAPEEAALIARHAYERGVPTHPLGGRTLDHGSMVPLFFVREAGYRGRVLVASLPYPGNALELLFGEALREAAEASQQRWALLASGDMSHRLASDAPAGFEPRAHEFDRTFTDALRRGDLRQALDTDRELQQLAAEDVVQSTAVAAAAVRFDARGSEVFAYEAPFGVGYLEALLHTKGKQSQRETTQGSGPEGALIDSAWTRLRAGNAHGPFSVPEREPSSDRP